MKEHCELHAALIVEEKPISMELIRIEGIGYRVEVKDGDRSLILKGKSMDEIRDSLKRTLTFLTTGEMKGI